MARSKSKPASEPKSAPAAATPSPPSPTWDERLIKALLPFWQELAGGMMLLLAILVILYLAGIIGPSLADLAAETTQNCPLFQPSGGEDCSVLGLVTGWL